MTTPEPGTFKSTRRMNMKIMSTIMRILIVACVVSGLIIAGAAYAAKPVQNVSAKKHPHIAAAQKLVAKAFETITAAQQANEFDMAGHAQKAKELLEQANAELKQAALEANQNKGK
jgi:hypothetical protein